MLKDSKLIRQGYNLVFGSKIKITLFKEEIFGQITLMLLLLQANRIRFSVFT